MSKVESMHFVTPRRFWPDFARGFPALGLAVLLGGCVSPIGTIEVEANKTVIESIGRYQKVYTLQAGDLVEVYVHRQPEFSRQGTIRPDGYLTLPVIDEIKAVGLTPRQLDNLVTEALSSRLKEPEVTIFVQNIVEPMVYVIGDVGAATPVPLRRAKTLAQVVAQVSGILRTGDMEQIAIIRLQNNGKLRATMLEDIGQGQSGLLLAMQNTSLQAEDIIFVPESKRSQFVRWIQDYINTPSAGLAQILTPYLQLKTIQAIEENP